MIKRFQILIIVAIFFGGYAYATESSDSTEVTELKEIVVEGDTYRVEGEKQILMLSKENRNYGTNALDAISSLNFFKPTLNETTLTTLTNESVFILINGIPSTGVDLRTFKGKDIKTVEFYAQAPAQYLAFTTGPVVNVVMKKVHDLYYSGYFNTNNAVNTGFGTNQATLSFRDSLNQISLNYFVDYRNIHSIEKKSYYQPENSLSSGFEEEQVYKGALHQLSANYQRFTGRYYFYTKLTLSADPRRQLTDGAGWTGGDQTNEFANFSNLKSNSRSANLTLFYNRALTSRSTLTAQVTNDFGDSYSVSELTPIFELGNSQINSEIQPSHSRTDNTFYSLRGQLSYLLYTGFGKISASGQYDYQKLTSKYEASKSVPHSNAASAFIGYSNNFNPANHKWYVPATTSVSVGFSVRNDHIVSLSNTAGEPYVQGYIDWWPQSTGGFTTQITLRHTVQSPNLSMLTAATTNMNYDLFYRGNTDLKKGSHSIAKFLIGYYPRKSRNSISVIANLNYSNKPIATIFTREGGINYVQPYNLNYIFDPSFYLMGNWYPAKWIRISPYLEYYVFKYSTLTDKVSKGYLRYGGTVTFMKDSWSMTLAANSPTRTYSGDFEEDGAAQYAVNFQYKYRNWAFGVSGNFRSGLDKTIGRSPIYSYAVEQKWKPLYYLTRINVVYSFSIGRSRNLWQNPATENLNNTGLNEYNKPKVH